MFFEDSKINAERDLDGSDQAGFVNQNPTPWHVGPPPALVASL